MNVTRITRQRQTSEYIRVQHDTAGKRRFGNAVYLEGKSATATAEAEKGTDGSLVPQCRSLVIVTLMGAVAGFNHLMLQPPRPTVHCVAAPVQAVPAMIPRLHASF